MMNPETELDKTIAEAYAKDGEREAANRVWLTLLKSTLYLAVDTRSESEEGFQPLVALIGEQCFLAAFDSEARFIAWSGEHAGPIQHITLTGRDLLAGMGDNVYLALNPGTPFYKEFSPDEVKHLKKIIARVDQLKEAQHEKQSPDSDKTDPSR